MCNLPASFPALLIKDSNLEHENNHAFFIDYPYHFVAHDSKLINIIK